MKSLVAAASLAAAACVGLPHAERAVIGAVRPPFAGPVKVIMEGAPLPAGVEEIAIVSATGTGLSAKLPDVLKALQAEAAAVGANAVVRVRYDAGASTATATGVAVFLR